jgi:hypothetical protein
MYRASPAPNAALTSRVFKASRTSAKANRPPVSRRAALDQRLEKPYDLSAPRRQVGAAGRDRLREERVACGHPLAEAAHYHRWAGADRLRVLWAAPEHDRQRSAGAAEEEGRDLL